MIRRSFLVTLLMPVLSLVVLAAGCDGPERQPGRTPKTEHVKVVAFTASWCGPCQRNKPILAQLEARGVEVVVVDVDATPDLAAKYNVTSVPTYFVHVGGRTPQRTQDVNVVVALLKPLLRR